MTKGKKATSAKPDKRNAQQRNSGQAERYWEDEVAPLIKGINVSNLPMVFWVRLQTGDWITVDSNQWVGPGQDTHGAEDWPYMGPNIRACVREFEPDWDLPRGWTYEKLLKKMAIDDVPNEHDIANPLHYTLDGEASFADGREFYADNVRRHFRLAVCDRWVKRRDDKGKGLQDFLNHHLGHGGAPRELIAFVKHTLVSMLIEHPCFIPWLEIDGWKQQQENDLLIKELNEWTVEAAQLTALARAEAAQVPVAAPKQKRKRPALRLLALVHALRWVAKDKSANITEDNAGELAKTVGGYRPSSGGELLKTFNRYHLTANAKNERINDGAVRTVKERYLMAISLLEEHPEAKAIAEAELQEVSERK